MEELFSGAEKMDVEGAEINKKDNGDGDMYYSGAVEASATLDSTETDIDITSTEAALAIDHVFEQILSLLEKPDLLNCRLVCHYWKLASTAELQKETKFNFFDYNFRSSRGKTSLQDLNNLLQTSTGFPCTKFNFVKTHQYSNHTLRDPVLQDFLYIHGAQINELVINFSDKSNTDAAQEAEIIEQISNLLLHQTPNLRSFDLRTAPAFDWQNLNSFSACTIPLNKTDPEFQDIISRAKSIGVVNTKLKIIHLWGQISAKLLETIIQLAPNLKEIILDEFNYRYLLDPLNRMHLLRKLIISPYKYSIESLEKLSTAARHNDIRLQLRQISLDLRPIEEGHPLDRNVNENENAHENVNGNIPKAELEQRFVKIMNEFLELSSNSLEQIGWDGVVHLAGFKWPQFMPRLKKLELGNRHENHGHHLPTKELGLSTRFPKLRTIHLFDDKGQIPFSDLSFVTSLNFNSVSDVQNVPVVDPPRKKVVKVLLARELKSGKANLH